MLSNNSLVSIIMAAFNAEPYIKGAIESVLTQNHQNWELLIINDGSTDETSEVVSSFSDKRIKFFSQLNKGVSAARNFGLKKMEGDYFCFLDADDLLPPNSLSSRISKFNSCKELAFVDGIVIAKDKNLNQILRYYKPRFKGNPENELKQLSDSCFYGITWMIKRQENKEYFFNPSLKYSEDLLFYMENVKQGLYDYVEEVIYINRSVETSAMHNLKALAKGYKLLLSYLLNNYTYTFKQKIKLITKIKVLIIKLSIKHFLNEKKVNFNFRLL